MEKSWQAAWRLSRVRCAALGLMRSYFEKERGIKQVCEVEAADINAWFAHMRKTPASRGKVRSERTIQTYARSALAFFHWLVRRETIERNPFDRVTFPKVGKPRIQTIDADEFERLLLACAPPQETGPMAERATGTSCGCSTTRASASQSCAVSASRTSTASTVSLRSRAKAPRSGASPLATTARATSCTTWTSTVRSRWNLQSGAVPGRTTSSSPRRAPR